MRCFEVNVLRQLGEHPVAETETPELVVMLKTLEARGMNDLASLRIWKISDSSGGRFRCGKCSEFIADQYPGWHSQNHLLVRLDSKYERF
jgi:hypothetical protein